MKKRIITLALACVLLLALGTADMALAAEPATAAGAGDTSVEPSSSTLAGNVYETKLSNDATAFVYVPNCENYGNRATSTPILLVYGNEAWTAETAEKTAISSGLADIAAHETGPVVFVNPKGSSWSAEDADSYLAVKDMFSDGTGNSYNIYNDKNNEGRSASTVAEDGSVTLGKYPGTCTRMYVFAEGTGANFAYENLAQGIYAAGQYSGNAVWKPVGMFLLNATSTKAVDLKGVKAENYKHIENDAAREIPVVIANGTETVVSAFRALNSVENINVRTVSAKTLADAKNDLLDAYDSLLEHHMTRDMGEGVTLLPLRSAAQQGLVETKETFVSKNGTKVIYYQYLPKNYTSLADGTVPIVFGFHGGGNNAEMYAWSSGWPEVAGKNGFIFVSVDQHVRLQSDENLGIIVELLNSLEEKYHCIDSSRVYASGFSMGSVMSSLLGFTYDDIFVGINPTNAITFQTAKHGNIVPTFYNAGENSHYALTFINKGAMCECPTSNVSGRTSVLNLMVGNGVMTKTEADAYIWPEISWNPMIAHFDTGDALYGIEADNVVTVDCSDYYGVSETIRYYNSKDGNCYTALSSTTYAGHEPIWEVTKNAWEFMSQFSRNPDGSIAVSPQDDFHLTVNDKEIEFEFGLGKPYINSDSRTMVPLRAAAYAMGLTEADLRWDNTSATAFFRHGNTEVSFTEGSNVCTILKSGKHSQVQMDTKLVNHNGRVYAPIRFLAEALGFTATWDAASHTANISTKIENTVKVSGGLISGVQTETPGVTLYKGVPYAAAPVGENRWKAPQPVKSWDGVMVCDTFSTICPQSTTAYGDYQREFYSDPYPEMSEDCLYLNIWAPEAAANEKLPVMVYIHGGGNGSGWSYEKEFDGEGIASRGVILVTINYRLGVFGFLAHPDLTAEAGGSSGNYGLMDQIAALQWVQDNIAAFGGDPNKVTMFGQSAGAMDMTMLVCSEKTAGLVDRAIFQSGGFLGVNQADTSLADAEAKGVQMTTDLGKSIQALREMDGKDLYAATAAGAYTGTCVDGYVLASSRKDIIEAGKYLDIDYMIGTNKDEFGGIFDVGTTVLAERQLALGRRPAYAYYFTRHMPGVDDPSSTCYGAFHTAECWYIFETLDRCWRAPLLSQADHVFAAQMADYWTNFAKTGNPNGAGQPNWASYTTADKNIQILDIQA